jgi:hypothetical protein
VRSGRSHRDNESRFVVRAKVLMKLARTKPVRCGVHRTLHIEVLRKFCIGETLAFLASSSFLLPTSIRLPSVKSVTSSESESVAELPCSLITPFQINSSHLIPRILPQTIRKKSRSLPKTLHIVQRQSLSK